MNPKKIVSIITTVATIVSTTGAAFLPLAAGAQAPACGSPALSFNSGTSNILGSFGTGVGQFDFPSAVHVDSSGNIYVLEVGNNRIQKFNSAGSPALSFAGGTSNILGSFGTGVGQFDTPSGIHVDSSDNIYVAEQGNNRIQKFNSAGVPAFSFSGGTSNILGNIGSAGDGVTAVHVDSSGNIYVANSFSIHKFNSAGVPALSFSGGTSNTIGTGAPGSAVGEFDNALDIHVDSSGNIYVAESAGNRIQKFNSAGVPALSFSGGTSNILGGVGQLNEPSSVHVDSSGNIYVVETDSNQIQKFNSAGSPALSFAGGTSNILGSPGSGVGQFNAPSGIHVDSSGNIYVAEEGSDRIQKFACPPAPTPTPFPTPTQCGDPMPSFAGGTSNIIGTGTAGNAVGQFSNPFDTVVDSSGNIYVADRNNHRIQKFTSAGVPALSFAGGTSNVLGTAGTAVGEFAFPGGIDVDSSGNIYVTDESNQRIQKFTGAGVPALSFAGGTSNAIAIFGPISVKVDSSGNIYVARLNGHEIRKFTSAGVPALSFAGGTSNQIGTGIPGNAVGQFNLPGGVEVDSSGNIYVTERLNHRVQKFTSAGVPALSFAGGTSNILGTGIAGGAVGAFSVPGGVRVDSLGNIFVTELANSRIQKFTSAGVPALSFAGGTSNILGGNGAAVGQFSSPYGIDVDSSGNIFVAEVANHRIQKFFCPTPTPTPGAFKDILTFSLQTVGNGPATFDPIGPGAVLKVFNIADTAFTAAYGSTFASWKTKLDLIWTGSTGLISSCSTDGDGACTANKAAPGNYLTVGRYVDTADSNTVYVSKNELTTDFNVDMEAFADLKIIKKYKDGALDSYGPGGQVKVVPGVPLASSGSSNTIALAFLAVAAGFGIGIYLKGRHPKVA